MGFLDHRSLALLFDLFRARHEEPHRAGLLLALGHDDDRLALLQLLAPAALVVQAVVRDLVLADRPRAHVPRLGQPAALAGEPGGHEGGAAEDEADGAAVDAYRGEGGGEAVDEAEVGQQRRAVVLLVEDGRAVDDVERGAVGQLHLREVRLLGHDLVDVGRQQRVGGEQRVAQGALHGGLELLLGSSLHTACGRECQRTCLFDCDHDDGRPPRQSNRGQGA